MSIEDIIAAAQKQKGSTTTKPKKSGAKLSEIKQRHLGDTRPLDDKHVQELAESIEALGLIEPLVVDNQNRLLAGAHRKAAVELLQQTNLSAFQTHFPEEIIPVHILGFDSAEDQDFALAVETAENEKRRDYTSTEIKAIAERLKASGYEDIKGRPKKGQKPLVPALSVVIGKSIRTVQRHLYGDKPPTKEPPEKSTTNDALLKKAVKSLQQWQETRGKSKKAKQLASKLPEMIQLIEDAMEEKS